MLGVKVDFGFVLSNILLDCSLWRIFSLWGWNNFIFPFFVPVGPNYVFQP